MFVCSVSLEQCKDRAFTESKWLSVTAQSIHSQTVRAIHRLPGCDEEYRQLNSGEACERVRNRKGGRREDHTNQRGEEAKGAQNVEEEREHHSK